MTKSARGELFKIVKDCKQRMDGGVGTEYDEVMCKVAEYISALELKLATAAMEREFLWTKELSKEEQLRVNASLLNKESVDE